MGVGVFACAMLETGVPALVHYELVVSEQHGTPDTPASINPGITICGYADRDAGSEVKEIEQMGKQNGNSVQIGIEHRVTRT